MADHQRQNRENRRQAQKYLVICPADRELARRPVNREAQETIGPEVRAPDHQVEPIQAEVLVVEIVGTPR